MSFDAGSLQALSTVMSGVSAVTSAVGAYTTGQANAAASSYQAAIARNNQIVAEQNARYALDRGRIAEQNQRQKTAQMIGEQRARMAASGVDIGSGTALRLQESTGTVGELDALTIRNNAMREAYGYRVQGSDFGASAGLLDMQASNSRKAGNIGAFSSIVGGASSVADKWSKWRTPNTGAYATGGYYGSQWSDRQ